MKTVKDHAVIPAKTVERLALYRRVLLDLAKEGTRDVFSHQLAALSNNSPAQVRRDLMFLDFPGGSPRNGYSVDGLAARISETLDSGATRDIALVGVGNLGRAILDYLRARQPALRVTATFDVDQSKAGREIAGCPCYHIDVMKEVVQSRGVTLGVITVPAEKAQDVAERMVDAGIRGILNFAPIPLRLPSHVFTDRLDITMTLEKIAYFASRV